METSGNDPNVLQQRMLELEQELIDFQESSKELEQALEDELRDLETEKASLAAQVHYRDVRIAELTKRIVELTAEVNQLTADVTQKEKAHNLLVADLKQKLVSMEILNDDMVSQDRILESKLRLATQFNNELLEKIAMVENDLELEKQENAKHKLTISNLQNAPAKLTRSKRDSTYRDLSFANGTVLDINEMLATEPPAPIPETHMPRSESLTIFQELNTKSGLLRQKVGEMNTSLALKSNSTTQVSKAPAKQKPGKPDSDHGLTHSLSIRNLAKLQLTTAKSSPTSRKADGKRVMSTQSKKSVETRSGEKNSKIRSVMKSFFA